MSGFELLGRRYHIPVPLIGILEDGEPGLAGVVPAAESQQGNDIVSYAMTEDAVDLAFANTGRAPFLQEHCQRLDAALGSLTAAWIDNACLHFTARLLPMDAGAKLWSMLSAGFSVSVSIGTSIIAAEVIGATPLGGRRIQVTRWALQEVSAVAVGANPGAFAVRLGTPAADEILATRKTPDLDAARDRLRVDHWTRWAVTAGFRLAEQLGTDPDFTAAALQAEVEQHCSQLVDEQIA